MTSTTAPAPTPAQGKRKQSSILSDLLLAEHLDRRLDALDALLADDPGRVPPLMGRWTVFATYACDLDCFYCNTVRLGRGQEAPMTPSLLGGLLAEHAESSIERLHLTGGEASMLPRLPEMVAQATARGIGVSLTSNGMASPTRYRALLDAGLAELRVSYESHDEEVFDHRVRRSGASARVHQTLRALVAERTARAFHLVLNVGVGTGTAGVVETVERAISLGPDDVKLLSLSQERDSLTSVDFAARSALQARLVALADALGPEAMPLLRLKIPAVLDRESVGYLHADARRLFHRCYIPLLERTFDARHYYPCPVWVREGGPPVGPISDSAETQARRSLAWVEADACLEEPICRSHCVGCLRNFNLEASLRVWGRARLREGSTPVAEVIDSRIAVSDDEIEAMFLELTMLRARWSASSEVPTFLVIKPQGMAGREHILSLLGSAVLRRFLIPHWSEVELRLRRARGSEPTARQVRRGIVLARVLAEVEDDFAELVQLDTRHLPLPLATIKDRFRDELGTRTLVVRHHEGGLAELYVITRSPVHVPDAGDEPTEWALLRSRAVSES